MKSELHPDAPYVANAALSSLTPLSQGQFKLLETCPRKFQHIYLEQLGTPVSPDQQERLAWGSRFHLLMQQRELGLPVASLVEEDAQLQHWVTALVNAASDVLTPNPQTFRESEHCRTLNFQGYLLTVIYDLLIEDEKSAQILDWKTYPQPKNRQWLATDWQTRLYLYVLAETSDYAVEQLSMTYWFVKSQPRPQSLKFTYSAAQHDKTRQDLTTLLTQLSGWLQRYQYKGIDFPQVAESTGRCSECNFAVRCQRTSESSTSNSRDFFPNLADIQEVSI
ncbi:MAG TPA: PD-(D/E)XK nuclease family protein [Cyanobacteria bacterium UBA8553]|nr:PD-(D/E)XK nuclease family protein [Cyanobacteria bacterium UBA8553]